MLLMFALGLNGECGDYAELIVSLNPTLAAAACKLQVAASEYAKIVKETVFHKPLNPDALNQKLDASAGRILKMLAASSTVRNRKLSDIAMLSLERV